MKIHTSGPSHAKSTWKTYILLIKKNESQMSNQTYLHMQFSWSKGFPYRKELDAETERYIKGRDGNSSWNPSWENVCFSLTCGHMSHAHGRHSNHTPPLGRFCPLPLHPTSFAILPASGASGDLWVFPPILQMYVSLHIVGVLHMSARRSRPT